MTLRWMMRILVGGGFVGLLVFLIAQDRVWSGTLDASYTFGKISPYIQKLVPDGRVLPVTKDDTGKWFSRMVIDPVYFEVKVPRTFKEVTVQLTYKNQGQSWIEMGPQYDKDQYALYPVENQILESLDWPVTSKEDISLFQKKKSFETVDAFISNHPKNKKVVTYHTESFGDEMNMETNLKSVDFILAQMPRVKREGEITRATVTIPLEHIALSPKGTYRFMISAPKLDQKKAMLDFYEIRTTFTGPIYE